MQTETIKENMIVTALIIMRLINPVEELIRYPSRWG